MSAWLAKLVVRRPGLVLLVALLLSAALVPIALRIRLDTELTRMVPANQEEAQAFARFARSFIAEQVLIVVAESDDPAQLLAFADNLAAKLPPDHQIAEVSYKLSGQAGAFLQRHLLQLLTVDELETLGPKLAPQAMRLQARRIRSILSAPGGSALTPIFMTDPLGLLPLISDRMQSGLPVDTTSGYFRSKDGHALIIYVRPKTGSFDIEADRALIARVSAAATALGARVTEGDFTGKGIEIGYTGPCAYTLYYRDWLHRDLFWSMPLSLIAVLMLFAFFFRALRVLPMVFLPLALGVLWTGAAAVVIFGRVNAVSLTFGTVLFSIGIDFPIQIYNRLREELRTHEPKDALERTVVSLAGPSLVATLGPALVFFACGLSDYKGLAELGVLAGIGLCLNLLAMLTVFPSLLAVLPARMWARPSPPDRERGFMQSMGQIVARRPRTVLLAALGIGIAAVPLALRIKVDQRLITLHPSTMPPVLAEHEMSKHFGERERMLVALVEDTDAERALERADAWTTEADRLRRLGLLRGYQSAASLFPSLATQAARAKKLATFDPPAAARELAAALEETGADVSAFEPFLAQLRTPAAPIQLDEGRKNDLAFILGNHVHDEADGSRRVATFLYTNPDRSDEVTEALRAFARGPAGGVVTGSPIVESVLRRIVIHDTIQISIVSAVGIAILLALYYRRWRPWVAVMTPLLLAWVLFGAALGALGLPLNLFNLLAVPLVIGYGIDDHIFLVHRFEEAPERGAGPALVSTGRAIVLTSLSTMAGFAGLGVARFDGIRLFGVSGALAVFFCLLSAFAVLPALLTVLWRPSQGK